MGGIKLFIDATSIVIESFLYLQIVYGTRYGLKCERRCIIIQRYLLDIVHIHVIARLTARARSNSSQIIQEHSTADDAILIIASSCDH